MKVKFILGALATVLLTTSVYAARHNPHTGGCSYNKPKDVKHAKEELAMVAVAGQHFKKIGKTREAKNCLMVAEKYVDHIPGDKKEKHEVVTELKKALT